MYCGYVYDWNGDGYYSWIPPNNFDESNFNNGPCWDDIVDEGFGDAEISCYSQGCPSGSACHCQVYGCWPEPENCCEWACVTIPDDRHVPEPEESKDRRGGATKRHITRLQENLIIWDKGYQPREHGQCHDSSAGGYFSCGLHPWYQYETCCVGSLCIECRRNVPVPSKRKGGRIKPHLRKGGSSKIDDKGWNR